MIIIFTGSSVEPACDVPSSLAFVVNTVNSPKERNVHKEFKIGSGKLLDLDFKTGGTINVEGWDKDLVSVDAYLGGNDWEDINLEFNQTSGGISILSEYENSRRHRNSKVDFTIKVPKKFNLKFETMGGSVKLNNLEGDLKGTTMGGSMKLTNLKGYLSLKTMGGPISLTDSDVDGKVTTMGGKVNIENVTGNVDGKSMGGNVVIKNLKRRDGSGTGKEVHITTMGGDIDLNTAPYGASVNTMGGDITINSAEKYVKAKTMGGKILLRAVNGSIRATTMGGDIDVTETGTGDDRNIELKSMSGDITLVVPADFPMDVVARITYDKDDRGRYKIYSDYNLNETYESRDDGWFNDDDSEVLKGTGRFNGGKNMVTISTVVGNIYIKKAK